MRHPEVIFKTNALPIIFLVVALGFHLFLRGHNAPGGGFIAGLVMAIAILIYRMTSDQPSLNLNPHLLLSVGLVVAVLTGVVPMLFGYSFLKSSYGYVTAPFIGKFEWATAALFDLGVFLVVVGATLEIINLLAEDATSPAELEN
jgi:multicomponent Na+:H+ antiporter subunit B